MPSDEPRCKELRSLDLDLAGYGLWKQHIPRDTLTPRREQLPLLRHQIRAVRQHPLLFPVKKVEQGSLGRIKLLPASHIPRGRMKQSPKPFEIGGGFFRVLNDYIHILRLRLAPKEAAEADDLRGVNRQQAIGRPIPKSEKPVVQNLLAFGQ